MGNGLATAFNKVGTAVGIGAAAVGVAAAIKYAMGKINITPGFNLLGDSHFPQDLENYKHHISFDFVKFQRRSIFQQPFLSGSGSIKLPIPANLVDRQTVNYAEETPGLLMGSGIEAGLKNGGAVGGAVGGALGAATQFGATAAGIGTGIEKTVNAVGQAAPFVLGAFGVAVNPFLTVLFKSPTFKRHSFAWRLSPNDPKESTLLNNILTKFKYHMLPSKADSAVGAILNYPDMCIVKLYPQDNWLYKFKPCVVTDISINYAPNGNPSFYAETNAPSDVQLTINLLEIEYWLKEDYGLGGLNIPGLPGNIK
jgi:hypothetical protein